MNRYDRQRTAGTLALAGGSLGIVAGLIQASVGSRIPDWSGAKQSPVALGLLTVSASVLSAGIGLMLRCSRELPPGGRTAAIVGVLIPAGLCFTTVGPLWYLPGIILLGAAAVAVSAGGLRELGTPIKANWTHSLMSALGAFEVLMAVTAAPLATALVGVAAGAALFATPWVANRSPRSAIGLLLAGALPFAVITWWSLATPLIAVLALALGLPTIGGRNPQARPTRSLAR